MAVGDVISGQIVGAGTFQPAAGVEIMITSCLVQPRNSDDIRMTDGANQAIFSNQANTANSHMNMKFLITNSLYLYLNAGAGVYSGYTGIQIK